MRSPYDEMQRSCNPAVDYRRALQNRKRHVIVGILRRELDRLATRMATLRAAEPPYLSAERSEWEIAVEDTEERAAIVREELDVLAMEEVAA